MTYLTFLSDPRHIQNTIMNHFSLQETTELDMSNMIVLDVLSSSKEGAVKSRRRETRDWRKVLAKAGPQICAKTGESRSAGKTFAIVKTPQAAHPVHLLSTPTSLSEQCTRSLQYCIAACCDCGSVPSSRPARQITRAHIVSAIHTGALVSTCMTPLLRIATISLPP